MFQRLHRAKEEGAVADRDDQVLRDAPQLLIDFVDVGFGAFVKEGVIDVVGVIDAFCSDFGAADIGAVVATAGHDVDNRAVRLNHVDFLRRGASRHKDFAGDAGTYAVSSDAVTGVAATVLHDVLDADAFAVGDEDSRAPVFERQGRHEVVHFQQDVVIKADDGRHALAHGNCASDITVERHDAFFTVTVRADVFHAVFSHGRK